MAEEYIITCDDYYAYADSLEDAKEQILDLIAGGDNQESITLYEVKKVKDFNVIIDARVNVEED